MEGGTRNEGQELVEGAGGNEMVERAEEKKKRRVFSDRDTHMDVPNITHISLLRLKAVDGLLYSVCAVCRRSQLIMVIVET